MSSEAIHVKLLNHAAREAFKPLKLTQHGTSCVWLDDHGWWVGVIAFPPSTWSQGSYLNVGVMWLWDELPEFAYHEGGRVNDDGFIPYEDVARFRPQAERLMALARAEVVRYREQFATLSAAATYLRRKDGGLWDSYHAAIANGYLRRLEDARRCFATVHWGEEHRDAVQAVRRKAQALEEHLYNEAAFRKQVGAMILRSRVLLRLPPLDAEAITRLLQDNPHYTPRPTGLLRRWLGRLL